MWPCWRMLALFGVECENHTQEHCQRHHLSGKRSGKTNITVIDQETLSNLKNREKVKSLRDL